MITIEEAKTEYLNRLLEIEADSFDEESYPLSKRAFRYHLKKGDRIFVARVDQKISAYVLIFRYACSFRVYSIATSKECRGKGLAKKLLAFVLEKAKTEHKKYVSLEVAESNTKAKKIYEGFGFRKRKVLTAYYPNGDTGYRMRVTL